MKKFEVFLKSIVQAKNFCDKLKNFDFAIEISDGNSTVNAKDVMEVLTLDLSDTVEVTFHTESIPALEETIKEFVK